MYQKVAVIGAGVMGSGIACQLANNKVDVLLYDLDENGVLIAQKALEKQIDSPQSQLVHPLAANLISPLSLKYDLQDVAECDLIIEAVVENLEIKQQLYQDLAKFVKKDALILSNTSTFALSSLTKGCDEDLKSRMAICHFFNPPRYMKLLEFIPGSLSAKNRQNLKDFLTFQIGKEVIICNDTPGFIANRLGCFLMELVLHKTRESGAQIGEVDAALTTFFGFPSTGIFGLYDLIGLDVMQLISKSLKSSLDPRDKFVKIHKEIPRINKMIEGGFVGRKGKGGFYKQEIDANGEKVKYALNIKSFEYERVSQMKFESVSNQEFLSSGKPVSKFITSILDEFFTYVLSHQEEICQDFYSIDKAMKLGYGWKFGPYEMMKKFDLVPAKLKGEFPADFDEENLATNCRSLARIVSYLDLKPIAESRDSRLWKIKNNKLCFEIATKMHILTPQVFKDLIEATQKAEELNADLIIYSDFEHFSAGADLNLFYNMAKAGDLDGVREYLKLGQRALEAVKYCKSPVISCAAGVALGGGCELILHADYLIAHQELKAGLVETNIGLIPAFGGLKESIMDSSIDLMLVNRLKLIIHGYKSTSALDFAVKMGIKNMSILANVDNLLDYALNAKFVKPAHPAPDYSPDLSSIEFSDVDRALDENQEHIWKTIRQSLPKDLFDKEALLEAEQRIFLELIQTTAAQEKIKTVIKR